jgi:hypothetical protein
MNYKINLQLMNNLKAIMKILIESKQSMFSCKELLNVNNSLYSSKVIVEPKPNKEVIEGKIKKIKTKKEKKNDKK